MKKHFFVQLIFIFAMITLGGCKTIAEEDKMESKVELKCDASGEGWYISDGTLYLSKIFYTVLYVAGNNCCVYEEPWIKYKNENQIRNIVIDADMIYTKTSYITGAEYADLAVEGASFLGGGPIFGNMDSLKSISIKRLNLGKITDISYMFANNSNLNQLDVSGLDLSGVTDASYLFANNSSLTNIDLNNLDTSNLYTIEGMFEGCTNLNSVSASSWNTSNIKDFSHLFYNCSSLTSVSLNGWNVNDADVSAMFYNCDSLCDVQLKDVILRNTIASNSMFNENNSISSYYFADAWNIYVGKDKQIGVISDECYVTRTYYDITTGIFIECVSYKKIMPAWYKESVEYLQGIDDCEKLYSTPVIDVYCNTENGEFSVRDVAEVAIDCLESTAVLNDEESILINNIIKKLEILAECKDGNYTAENMIEFLEMTEKELEILKGK